MRKSPEYQEKSRERLKNIIGKKFNTTMIFPLSQFEMAFGELWGHGKPEDMLTPEEIVNRKKWAACRENILNQGNHQMRNAKTEIDMYTMSWDGYKTTLIPVEMVKQEK